MVFEGIPKTLRAYVAPQVLKKLPKLGAYEDEQH